MFKVMIIFVLPGQSQPPANLHPIADLKNGHWTRVLNYGQHFNELGFQGFDFINGFECSDIYKFKKVNNLSTNIFELSFHQDGNEQKHKLKPIETSKNNSGRVVDFLIYKNYYVLIEKINFFQGIIIVLMFVEDVWALLQVQI